MFNLFKKTRERESEREKSINTSSDNNKVMKAKIYEIVREVLRDIVKKINNNEKEIKISIADIILNYQVGMNTANNVLKILEIKLAEMNLKVKRISGTLIISKDEHE